jgi:hypothetical protein
VNKRALFLAALSFANIAVAQTNRAHPARALKPETPHLNVVKEYVRELAEDEDLKITGERELSEAKSPNDQFSTGIYYSKSSQLELRSQIGMLKTMHLNNPYDSLIPSLITLYRQQIQLHQTLIDISGKFLAGPKEGVDYQALAAKVPEIRAELDESRKALFQVAALEFMILIDPKPDSEDHVSHLLITKAEKADLQDQLNIMLKDIPLDDKADHDYYISAAMILRGAFEKGHKCADEPWD